MKKSTYITFTALTVFMLLIMPYIPHHHHEGALCMIVEHCEVDDTDKMTSIQAITVITRYVSRMKES